MSDTTKRRLRPVDEFGMTSEAERRVMGNCRDLIRFVIDEMVFAADSGDTSWVEFLEDHDVEVVEGKDRPSDYFNGMSDEALFQTLISNGTPWGGMTSARKALIRMREEVGK